MYEVVQNTLIADKENFHLPEHLSGLLLGLFAPISRAFFLRVFEKRLPSATLGPAITYSEGLL